MNQKYYVSMTDKFMSYWGMSKDKINKLVIECSNYNEAEIVYNNAINRSEMKHVNICMNKPYYNPNRYYTNYHGIHDYYNWFQKGYFKK